MRARTRLDGPWRHRSLLYSPPSLCGGHWDWVHTCTGTCTQVHPVTVNGKLFYEMDLAVARSLPGIPEPWGNMHVMLHRSTLSIFDKHSWASSIAPPGCSWLSANVISFFYVRYMHACTLMHVGHSYT